MTAEAAAFDSRLSNGKTVQWRFMCRFFLLFFHLTSVLNKASRLCPFDGWLVGLSAGVHKNYQTLFHKTWMDDASCIFAVKKNLVVLFTF